MIHEVLLPERPDYPELRAAYEAEAAAVQRIADMKDRKIAVEAEVERLRDEQTSMASRMANGADVTGADVRRAAEALQDAEATLALLNAALPKAAWAAYRAETDRHTAEGPVVAAAFEPYRQAMRAAEQTLEAAKLAYDRAKAEADRIPDPAQADLNALLDAHGRDRDAPYVIAELRRVQQANESRRLSGQGPQLAWP